MSLPISNVSVLPGRCVLFLTDAFTGGPIEAVPVGLRAEFRVSADPASTASGSPTSIAGGSSGASSTEPSSGVVLGVLSTDHVGYASWDLSPLARRLRTDLDSARIGLGDSAVLELDSLTIRLAGPLAIEIDALDAAQIGSDAFVRLYATDPENLFQLEKGTFPAVQSPSLVDWYLSPASFSYLPAALVGADGCEALLPSNIATQRFKAYQILIQPVNTFRLPGATLGLLETPRQFVSAQAFSTIAGRTEPVAVIGSTAGASLSNASTASEIRILLTYSITWLPVGHGLGQILYSMALAPCEQVNLAVVDWSRTDAASRQEETGLTDSLTHDTLRDRNVGEVVDASLREYQRGSSTMAGASVVGGAAGVVGGALSLGTSYATTSGERNIGANTTQTLTDQFHQASAAIRDLRSTVVVQSTQQVSQDLQTRTVRNYNHSHALTLLYYEVLRHYRVVVELSDVTPALLVTQETEMKDFDETVIFTYRRFLETSLLIEELRPGFDAIEKLFAYNQEPPPPPPPPPPDPGNNRFVLFQFHFHTSGRTSPCVVKGWVLNKDADSNLAVPLLAADGRSDQIADAKRFGGQQTDVLGQGLPVSGSIAWYDVGYIRLHFDPQADENNQVHTGLDSIDVSAIDVNGAEAFLGHIGAADFEGDTPSENLFLLIPSKRPPYVPPPPPPPTALDRLTPDERSLRIRLIAHLNANKPYYYRQIWMGEDPNHRLLRMAGSTVDIAGTVVGLFQIVENRVVDVVGSQLVFPLSPSALSAGSAYTGGTFDWRQAFNPAISETLISLPTRGVFGEAKLGHCNASEVIDNTRFWDWQTSPCPDQAPAISGVSPQGLGSPVMPTPTALPASNLTIATPPAEPDPIGLKAALDVLKTPGIFNNLSGIDSLKGLLGSLSDAAAKVATAKKPDSPGPTPSPSPAPGPSPAPSPSPAPGPSPSPSPTPSPAPPPVPTPSPAPSPPTSPTPPPVPNPVPPSPKPQPKYKRTITLYFFFDTNEVMMGSWSVKFTAANDVTPEYSLMINDTTGVSGVAVGNKMVITLDSDFGGKDDIGVQVSGAIVQAPPSIDAGNVLYKFDDWRLAKTFGTTIKRADFDKCQTYKVVQKTETASFAISTTRTDTSASATVDTQTTNIEVGVTSTTEVGGSAGVASGKESVAIAAKGAYSISNQDQKSTQTQNGWVDQVTFTAKKASPDAPTITPLL